MDVAQALTNLIGVPAMAATLSLPGPTTHTYNYLLELVASVLYEPITRAPTVPKPLALAATSLAQFAYFPMISPDEVRRRYIDDALSLPEQRAVEDWEIPEDVKPVAEIPGDWDKVGVTPEEIEQYALLYLRQYRTMCVLHFRELMVDLTYLLL